MAFKTNNTYLALYANDQNKIQLVSLNLLDIFFLFETQIKGRFADDLYV